MKVAKGRPELAINRDGRTVADAISEFINYATDRYVGGACIDIATAYFNLGGYSLVADVLDRATGVRLLLGAEPGRPENRRRKLGVEQLQRERAAHARMQAALTHQERDLLAERDHLGFTREADASARRLVDWLHSGKVEVRRLEAKFLHGKAFMMRDEGHGVVAGSSNFTYAGLATNVELNLGNYTPSVVTDVQEWFDDLWDEAAPFDLAGLFESRFDPHLPQLIYLRMLWELYFHQLRAEADAQGTTNIHLTKFQSDGLWRARRILEEHNGVLIADEVGLGKTFLAGELIREAAEDRRQKVLVITPATLRDGPWQAFRREHKLRMELVSYEELLGDSRLNPKKEGVVEKLNFDPNDYALVVIDEAHNLRNPSTERAQAIRRLLAGSPPKKLVLLTATPVNNSLWDLYYLLDYFLRNDGSFAAKGIPSLQGHFAGAVDMNPNDLTPEHLFDVLDTVAVRRTRSFVKRFYPNDTIGEGDRKLAIVFPTPRVLKVTYDMDGVLPGFFDRFAAALDPDAEPGAEGLLSLARYAPSHYRLDGSTDAYEAQLAGLLRSGLLKRFESSPHAFAKTCNRMANSHDAFLSLLEHGRVGSGEALADWIATDSDEMEDGSLDSHQDRLLSVTDDAADYDVDRLRANVERDRRLLRAFAAESGTVTQAEDPTLAALVNELAEIAAEAQAEGVGAEDVRNRRKVLIFSYFADTVEWIVDHLEEVTQADPRLEVYRGRVASLAGASGAGDKKQVLWGFAPRTTDAPEGHDADRFDIVVATDVLAEGVNLQQARHIINYDLPWNPMRLVQRHGRIDRIGSHHREVFLRCVFPDERLDDLLGLEERLHHKIAQAAASVGVGEILPNQAAQTEINFTETREEIERLRHEDARIFERGGTARGALSGEEFRQELRQAVADPNLAEQIAALPWGSGSGMAVQGTSELGYVFCARVADSPEPVFRFVPRQARKGHADSSEAFPQGQDDFWSQRDPSTEIISETLACLDRAQPPDGFETPRQLTDEDVAGAFVAWELARDDILARWNHLSDKANLEPKVPRRLLRAAEIVRNHAPAGMTQDEIDRAVDTLSTSFTGRIIRTITTAVKSSSEPGEQAQLILDVIHDLGLQPQVAPEALPEICADDIYCVTWLALT